MQEFEERRSSPKETIMRFEKMLKTHENQFFDLDAYEQIVEHYIEEANWDKACQACDMGLSYFPYSVELMLDKAHALAQKQRYDDALEVIARALLFNPKDVDVLFMKGGVLNMIGQYQAAIDIYEQVLQLAESEEKDDIMFQMGQVYQNWGKFDQAIEHYKQAIAINIDNENAIYELAFCLDITDRLDESIAYYQELIDKDPYAHNAWYNLGIVYSRKDEHQKALEAYEYATLVKDDFASAHFNMANAYMNLGQYQKANESYLITLSIEGQSADLSCHLGASYEKLGNLTKALDYYKEAVRLDAQSDEGWYGIGVCLAIEQKWVEALHCVRRAIKINEFESSYWLIAAELEYKIGNEFSAVESFEKAESLDPENIDVWLKWSLVLFDQGLYNEAHECIERGLDELPDAPELYYRSVAYLIYGGRYKDALLNLEIALTLDYEMHTDLLVFFPELEKQKTLYKLIEQYRTK